MIEARVENRAELLRRALAASGAGRHGEALEIWSGMRAKMPHHLPAVIGVASALLGLGRENELARLAATQTGPSSGVFRALLAEHQEDWAAALAGWRAARDAGIKAPRVAYGVVNGLLRLGRAEEARSEAAAALAKGIDSEPLRALLVRSCKAIAEQRIAATPPLELHPLSVEMAPAQDPEALKALVLEFESLGRNCEFGMLQRQLGVEPVGLLRWSATRVDSLVDLLVNRLEGIGDPAQSRIRIAENGTQIQTRDTRYRFEGHIPIGGPRPDPETMTRKQCDRLRFLGRMLRDALETQSKIFVYQKPDLTDKEMAAIYRAVSEYGPNFLLCVRQADAAHPAGQVLTHERLVVGYIDEHGSGDTGRWELSIGLWTHFCRVASERRAAMLAEAVAA